MQKLIVKLILMLPNFILRAMSKKVVTQIRGRVMDPKLAVLAAQGGDAPGFADVTPAEARAGGDQTMALLGAPVPASVEVTNTTLPGPAGNLKIRIYKPKGATGPLPGLVWYHQGGCVVGSLDWGDGFLGRMAEANNMVLVNVDYRLAPEDPFPASYDDALASYRYVRDHAAVYGIDAARLAIGGDSAGGNLSAAITHALKAAGEAQPKLQLLIYPWVTIDEALPSRIDFGATFPLDQPLMDYFKFHYLGEDGTYDPNDLRCSPMSASDFSGLAPALIYTAGFDPLTDEGEEYGKRLAAAGVPVLFRCYENLTHSFTAMTGMIPSARKACEEITGEVKEWMAR